VLTGSKRDLRLQSLLCFPCLGLGV
jgi:hypothetical protein